MEIRKETLETYQGECEKRYIAREAGIDLFYIQIGTVISGNLPDYFLKIKGIASFVKILESKILPDSEEEKLVIYIASKLVKNEKVKPHFFHPSTLNRNGLHDQSLQNAYDNIKWFDAPQPINTPFSSIYNSHLFEVIKNTFFAKKSKNLKIRRVSKKAFEDRINETEDLNLMLSYLEIWRKNHNRFYYGSDGKDGCYFVKYKSEIMLVFECT
jgi:hypothetical protein